jgi:hypothetical protein
MFCRAFKFLLFASALGLGGLLAAALIKETVVGSGKAGTEDRAVGPVQDVSLSGIGNLTIRQGDTPALSVTADDNLLPFIETETSGKKLTIRTKSGYTLRPSGPVNITLTVPKLEKLTVSGSGNATAEKLTGDILSVKLSGAGNATLRDATYKSVTISLSGAGNARLTGTAEKATASISGAGEIDAAEFKVATAEVKVSGAGNASVWATDTLKARVSGAGDVTYKGNPRVEKKVSGAGSVKAR